MNFPDIIDEHLWFTCKKKCKGEKHYFYGNPHTFAGRVSAWCPHKELTFFVSLNEVEEMSEASNWWIKGFLCGNEPDPPVDEDQGTDYDSKEYKDWLDKCETFREKGVWVPQT